MKVAALDFGTNSFLCLIAKMDGNRFVEILHDTAQIVRLGQDLKTNKTICAEAMSRADECLKQFSSVIKKHKPDKILATATSAARDAGNQSEFLSLCQKYRIPVQIISGDLEAQLTFQGAVSSYDNDEIKRVVIDIGGGSTELICGTGHRLHFGKSADVGAVRMTENFLSTHPVEAVENKAMLAYIQKEIAELVKRVTQDFKPDQVIAAAGTPTELAKIEIGKFDPRKIDGYILKLNQIERYFDVFASTSVEDRIQKLNVSPGRADIIYAGTAILLETLKCLGHERLSVSSRGLRYGTALALSRGEL
jgi:exopolyphosphatase/guanosine-5'-triphosphate,3'-diphosphate pyrophosphatase